MSGSSRLGPSRPVRRRKQARPQELLAAALDVFGERGYGGTRMEEVAHRAGVSKGTVYRYFANKEALYEAVLRYVAKAGGGSQDEADEPAGTGAMRAHMRALWDETGSGTTSLARQHADQVAKRHEAAIVALLQRGAAGGEFRAVAPLPVARVLVASVLGLKLLHVAFGTQDHIGKDEVLDMLACMVEKGMRMPAVPATQQRLELIDREGAAKEESLVGKTA